LRTIIIWNVNSVNISIIGRYYGYGIGSAISSIVSSMISSMIGTYTSEKLTKVEVDIGITAYKRERNKGEKS